MFFTIFLFFSFQLPFVLLSFCRGQFSKNFVYLFGSFVWIYVEHLCCNFSIGKLTQLSFEERNLCLFFMFCENLVHNVELRIFPSFDKSHKHNENIAHKVINVVFMFFNNFLMAGGFSSRKSPKDNPHELRLKKRIAKKH